MSDEQESVEIKMDPSAFCREEVFTDQRIGTIRRMTPVKTDGSDDDSRPVRYMGSSQLMTPGGAIPLNFEIEADSLDQAVERFGPSAEEAMKRTMEELQELRRQSSSSIVVPGMEGAAGAGGFGQGGPGGGIQFP